MAKCPICGGIVSDTDTVCRFCGAKIQEEAKIAQERKERRESLTGVMHQLDDETLLKSVKAKYYGLGGIERNPEEAFKLCEELANRGSVEGIYLLGIMKYEAGELKTAYRLWKYASKRGHEPSKVKLAVSFDRSGPSSSDRGFSIKDFEEEDEDEEREEVGVINSVVMIICQNSCGTGFVIEDGLVVTNAHVVDGYKNAVCFFKKELGKDGSPTKVHELKVLGCYPEYDIAILAFRDEDDEQEFSDYGLPFADTVRIEEKVKTIGYPLGLPFSVSKGIVSNTSQNLGSQGKYHYQVDNLIQTDISINSGNSGGPLINTAGEVVGVISCRPTDANGGIGFAIPVSYVRKVLNKINK